MKLNGTHQLLAYADDVNILGGGTHTIKKNAEALAVGTKEIELELNGTPQKTSKINKVVYNAYGSLPIRK